VGDRPTCVALCMCVGVPRPTSRACRIASRAWSGTADPGSHCLPCPVYSILWCTIIYCVIVS